MRKNDCFPIALVFALDSGNSAIPDEEPGKDGPFLQMLQFMMTTMSKPKRKHDCMIMISYFVGY